MNRPPAILAVVLGLSISAVGRADDPELTPLERLSELLGNSDTFTVVLPSNADSRKNATAEVFKLLLRDNEGNRLDALVDGAAEIARIQPGVVLTVGFKQKPSLLKLRQMFGPPQLNRDKPPELKGSLTIISDKNKTPKADFSLRYDWIILGVSSGKVVAIQFDCSKVSREVDIAELERNESSDLVRESNRLLSESIQGKWKVASDVTAGTPTPLTGDEFPRLAEVEISDDSMSLRFVAKKRVHDQERLLAVDASGTPARIEVVRISQSEDQSLHILDGVIEVSDDDLRVCLCIEPRSDKDAPKSVSFEAANEQGIRLLVLKRSARK